MLLPIYKCMSHAFFEYMSLMSTYYIYIRMQAAKSVYFKIRPYMNFKCVAYTNKKTLDMNKNKDFGRI